MQVTLAHDISKPDIVWRCYEKLWITSHVDLCIRLPAHHLFYNYLIVCALFGVRVGSYHTYIHTYLHTRVRTYIHTIGICCILRSGNP